MTTGRDAWPGGLKTEPRSAGSPHRFALLSKERTVAGPDFNRWRIPVAAVTMHLCIGSVYSWSIFNPALTKELGVIVSAADDWSVGAVVWVFSLAIVFLGLAAALAGKWLENVGPTPGLYNTTMFAMAGLLALAFIANLALRPVAPRYHVSNTHPEPA